jgi:hypothetical protein
VEFQSIGKFLLLAGVIIALLGIGFLFFEKIPFLGKLPGDIRIEKENFKFYFPITTSILVSVLISAILWLIGQFKK